MPHSHQRLLRINVQLTSELKDAVARHAASKGESVSEFLRHSAEKRVKFLEAREQEKRLEQAYLALAEESRSLAAEHEATDLEDWE